MSQAAGWSTGGNGLLRRQLDRLFQNGTLTGLSDAELLRRFNARRDEAAFEALVERHGPMVLGVCRRMLGGDPGAADDAFQATFLILVRKAGVLRDGERLGPWLYGVALRVARRARQQRERRRGREAVAVEPASLPAPEGLDHEALARAELAMVLDEELGRLPEKFRAPVVLCYLEGLTHEQAAGRLSCPVGTVRSRMATARDTLRTRLARRGVTVPAGLSAAALGVAHAGARAALPPALVASTTRLALSVAAGGLASGVVPGAVSALTDGVLRIMTMHKLLIGLALGATLVATAGGGLAAARHLSGGVGAALAQDQGDAPGPGRQERVEAQRLRAELAAARDREATLMQQAAELRLELERLKQGPGGGDAAKPGRLLSDQQLADLERELRWAQIERQRVEIEWDVARQLKPNDPQQIPKAGAEEADKANRLSALQERLEYLKQYEAVLEKTIQDAQRQPSTVGSGGGAVRGLGGVSAMGGRGSGGSGLSGGFGRGGGLAGPGAAGGGGVASGGAGIAGMPGMMGRGSGSGMGMPGMGGMMGGSGGMMGRGGMLGDMMMGGPGGGSGMGMPGMGGMMGAGAPIDPSQPIMTASIITLQPKGTNRVLAHSAETGRWAAYTLPQGVTAIPILTTMQLLALDLRGDAIPQLAVFNSNTGRWSVQPLKEPAQGEVMPVVAGPCVAYSIGPRVYAYSAEADKWDVLELDEPATPSVSPQRVFVQSGGKLAVFSAKTGEWSVIDPERRADEGR